MQNTTPNIAMFFEQVKTALDMSDEQMSKHLFVNLPAIRAMRNSAEELPSHAVFDLLDTCGLVRDADIALLILTPAARNKLHLARSRRKLTDEQKIAIEQLRSAVMTLSMKRRYAAEIGAIELEIKQASKLRRAAKAKP